MALSCLKPTKSLLKEQVVSQARHMLKLVKMATVPFRRHRVTIRTFSLKKKSRSLSNVSDQTFLTNFTFCRSELPYRVFNTWLGDPSKLLILEGVLKVMKRDNLLENVRVTGDKMLKGLKEFQKEYPHLLNSARGRGTFLAISCATPKLRDEIVNKLKLKGVQSGGCGEDSIRFRPALIFAPQHADILFDKFRSVLKEIK